MRTEWLSGPEALSELRDDWDRLTGRGATPFSRHAWFAAAYAAFTTDALAVLTAREGTRLAAAVPVHRHGAAVVAPVHHTASPYVPPMTTAGAAAVAAELGRGDVRFDHLPAAHPLLPALTGRAGRMRLLRPGEAQPVVRTGGTWSAFRARSRSGWSTEENRTRKMRREHDAVFRIVAEPHDLDAQLAAGLALEAAGWKGAGGTAILQRPADLRFHREIATRFHADGQLRLSEILLDGELVAFDLTLLAGNRLYLLKTCYSERHPALSPGLVLRLATFKRCFELGLDAHELGGAADPWKLRYADAADPLCLVDVARPGPRAVARHAGRRARDAGRVAKRWVGARAAAAAAPRPARALGAAVDRLRAGGR